MANGIAGLKGRADAEVIHRLLRGLEHRGLPGYRLHHHGNTQIGAVRGVPPDVEATQKEFNPNRTRSIVFNGIILNRDSLKGKLQDHGHRLNGNSDAEIILSLYEAYGERCVEYLKGAFAFAIMDGGRLFLARDRLGIKPLYYTILNDSGLFLFASEIKALLQCEHVPVTLDMQTFADNYVLNFPVGGRTFFENIRSLSAGCTLMIFDDQRGVQVKETRYYQLTVQPDDRWTLEEAQQSLTGHLQSAVASHLIPAARIGVSLSGGLDSSLLALLMSESQPAGIKTFTVADHLDHPDVFHARRLASEIKARHQIITFSFEDYVSEIPTYVAAEEQPSTLTSLPVRFLCRQTVREADVCLVGEGADALFGGYQECIDPSYAIRSIRNRLESARQVGLTPGPEADAIIEQLTADPNRTSHLKSIYEINLRDPVTRMNLEILDRQSISAGVEFRFPYYQDELVEFVNSLPFRFKGDIARGIQKYILKRWAIARYGEKLFDVVLRKKLGFPMAGSLFLRKLNRICTETMSQDYHRRHEYGRFFPERLPLVLFDLFREVFFKHRGFPPADFDTMRFIRNAGRSENVRPFD